MRHTVRVWRPTWRILALTVAIAAAPLPALAGEPTPPSASAPGISASIAKVAATETLATGLKPRVAASQQGGAPSTDLGSKSFFKTPAGIIALVAAGVAVGFTIYSTSNDRISSPKVSYEGGVR